MYKSGGVNEGLSLLPGGVASGRPFSYSRSHDAKGAQSLECSRNGSFRGHLQELIPGSREALMGP